MNIMGNDATLKTTDQLLNLNVNFGKPETTQETEKESLAHPQSESDKEHAKDKQEQFIFETSFAKVIENEITAKSDANKENEKNILSPETLEAFKEFLQNINLSKQDKDKIFELIEKNDSKAVTNLLKEEKINPAAINDMFSWATENGEIAFMEILLHTEKVNLDVLTEAFLLASKKGNTKVVELLLNRVDPAAEDNEALHWVCENGYPEILTLLLSTQRVNIANSSVDALSLAAKHGHKEVVAILLQQREINLEDYFESIIEAEDNNYPDITLLLKNIIVYNKVLYQAAENGEIIFVEKVLKKMWLFPPIIAPPLPLLFMSQEKIIMYILLIRSSKLASTLQSIMAMLCVLHLNNKILTALLYY